jgi:Cell division protein FtsI/penicillin-binding protein 2
MAGAVEDGTWRPPQLVLSPVPKQSARPQQLGSTVLATLRPMMRAVVTTGTAANVGFQAGVFGKTGTAEFGTSSTPRVPRVVRRLPRGCGLRGAGRGWWRRRRRVGADRERVPA